MPAGTAAPSTAAAAWLAATVASVPMAAIAVFWGFIWLLGSNGYFDGRGDALLFGNAALALACLGAGIAASALLARRFRRRGRSQAFAVLAGAVLGTCAGTATLAIVGLAFSLVVS